MKKTLWTFLVILGIFIGYLIGTSPANSSTESNVFEYEMKSFHRSDYVEDVEKVMNELGKQGWELVCSYSTNALIFKRRK